MIVNDLAAILVGMFVGFALALIVTSYLASGR